ncbi:MAG TPA: hypothetical protein VMU80_01950 [Bryobacteraceae bacterium]|nr:hypothetical protein [Bryobacteraceae bacterium]
MLRLSILAGLLAFRAVVTAASPVGVYLDFDKPPLPSVLQAMEKEAAHVLAPVGIDVTWRFVSQNQGNEAFARLAVVRFTGICAPEGLLPATQDAQVLGSTAVVSGQVLPFSQVYCDAVRRMMPDIEYAPDRLVGDAALGRVLGRVMAHELYHAVLGTTHHAATGLAKAVQTTDDLKSGAWSFETK